MRTFLVKCVKIIQAPKCLNLLLKKFENKASRDFIFNTNTTIPKVIKEQNQPKLLLFNFCNVCSKCK